MVPAKRCTDVQVFEGPFVRGVSFVNSYQDPLTLLIDQGKKRGFITFQQVNVYLPDEGGSPQLVDDLVLALDQSRLDLIEDPDQPREALATQPAEKVHEPLPVRGEERAEVLEEPAAVAL